MWSAADALLADGRRPTIEGVRHKLGRGSPNTVTPYLNGWFKALSARLSADSRAQPTTAQAMAMQLWDAAMAAAREEAGQDLVTIRQAFEVREAELAAREMLLARSEERLKDREIALGEALDLMCEQVRAATGREEVLMHQLAQKDDKVEPGEHPRKAASKTRSRGSLQSGRGRGAASRSGQKNRKSRL